MDEHLTETPHPPRRKKPLAGILAILLLIAAAVVITCALKRAADPAAMIPKDVAFAVTVDLTKSADKQAAMSVIQDIFEDAGVKDPQQKLFDFINRELKIKIEKDVLPSLTGTGGVAVLPEATGDTPSMAAFAVTRSGRDSEKLVKLIIEKSKLKKDHVKERKYGGFVYHELAADYGPSACLGAVKTALVFASNESAFKKMADTANGKPNLLSDENYTKLRKTSSATVAGFYMSGEKYYEFIQSMSPIAAMAPGVGEMMKGMMEGSYAAGTCDASADGIKLQSKTITKKSMGEWRELPIDELAAGVPGTAAAVLVVQDFSAYWKILKDGLFSDSTAKSQIESGIAQAKAQFGFDPFADLIERIQMLSIYFAPQKPAKPSQMPGSAVLNARVDKPAVVNQAIGKILALAKAQGIQMAEADVSGTKVTLGPKANPTFWTASVKDRVVLGVTGTDAKASAKDSVAVAGGDGKGIVDTPAFQLAKRQLPSKSCMLVYVDAGTMMSMLGREMTDEDRKIADAIARRAGVIACTGNVRGTTSEGVVVLPFRK